MSPAAIEDLGRLGLGEEGWVSEYLSPDVTLDRPVHSNRSTPVFLKTGGNKPNSIEPDLFYHIRH